MKSSVPKETTKKRINGKVYHYCPMCESRVRVIDNFCSNCGQAIKKKKLVDYLK